LRGTTLRQRWAEGPRTFLGLMVSDFPNMFLLTGPGSPGIRSHVILQIEQHVEWVADLIQHARSIGHDVIDATKSAEDAWTDYVAAAADATIIARYDNQYNGSNIPGKPRVYTSYLGGMIKYRDICDEIAAHGYDGLTFSDSTSTTSVGDKWLGFSGDARLGEQIKDII
jgi:cyclohexanone monooxygenase